jgi:hypothetical protein
MEGTGFKEFSVPSIPNEREWSCLTVKDGSAFAD